MGLPWVVVVVALSLGQRVWFGLCPVYTSLAREEEGRGEDGFIFGFEGAGIERGCLLFDLLFVGLQVLICFVEDKKAL